MKMTRNELLKLRNKDIKKRYFQLTSKRNLSVEYSLITMEREFYLTKDTIWLIVTETGFYKSSK